MGQGQDKIARTLLELQPTAIVELFLIYFNPGEYENAFFAFHGGSLFQKPITWQGLEYLPVPVETEGFEINANGRIARPKIRISNKDYIMTDLLLGFKDLQFAKIIRKRTFVKYLDNINFDGGNPWGQSDYNAELSNDTFIISQKTAENKLYVEFELTHPLDIDGSNINNRLILGSYCPFTYRGEGCNYEGIPLTNSKNENLKPNARSLGNFTQNNPNDFFKWRVDFNYEAGDIVYFENVNSPVNYFRKRVLDDEPEYERNDKIDYLRTYYVAKKEHISTIKNSPIGPNSQLLWERDQCSKSIDACKKRFNDDTAPTLYTQTIEEIDNFLDFSTNKIPDEIAEEQEIKLISNTSQFFPKNFYTKSFTIAMWISFPRNELKNRINYSIFTNANTPSNLQGGVGLNYYIRNGKLYQSFRILDSKGNLSNQTQNLETTNLLSYDGSYQFCLFEYNENEKKIKITLNNDEKSSDDYVLKRGESSFAFTDLDYLNNYFTNNFQINGNDYWRNNTDMTTPARIHSVIIWSRSLNSAEKNWLYRDENKSPGLNKEIKEIKSPRRLQEINTPYDSIKNGAILWLQDNISSYNSSNKTIHFYSEILNETQGAQSVFFNVSNLNYDIKNTQKNTLIYEYKYIKEKNDWLPFGGFPGTTSFTFGGEQN